MSKISLKWIPFVKCALYSTSVQTLQILLSTFTNLELWFTPPTPLVQQWYTSLWCRYNPRMADRGGTFVIATSTLWPKSLRRKITVYYSKIASTACCAVSILYTSRVPCRVMHESLYLMMQQSMDNNSSGLLLVILVGWPVLEKHKDCSLEMPLNAYHLYPSLGILTFLTPPPPVINETPFMSAP